MENIVTDIATYKVEVEHRTRMAGGILEGCELYEVKTTTYNIYRDGALVGFVFDVDDIAKAVAAIEDPARRPYGTRFD